MASRRFGRGRKGYQLTLRGRDSNRGSSSGCVLRSSPPARAAQAFPNFFGDRPPAPKNRVLSGQMLG